MGNADPRVKDGDTIVVWFSCGAASAIAVRETKLMYPRCHVRVVNNPVVEEPQDNRRFLADVEAWLGFTCEIAINPKFPNCSAVEVWEKKRYMSGVKGAPCTGALKKEARQHWEANNHFDWLVMGFCADEAHRAVNFRLTERPNLLSPLVDMGFTHDGCKLEVMMAGLVLPISYRNGFNTGNCEGCVKAEGPDYWNLGRVVWPEVFRQRAEMSRRLGVRLVNVKGERIYLDELPPDAKGRGMPKMPECGIFCEETPVQIDEDAA